MQLHDIRRIIRAIRNEILYDGMCAINEASIKTIIQLLEEFELKASNAKLILISAATATTADEEAHIPSMTLRINEIVDTVYSYIDEIYEGIKMRNINDTTSSATYL